MIFLRQSAIPSYILFVADWVWSLTLMISKGCITATWDQPEIRQENTSNHAVEEGKESISEGHAKIIKIKIQFFRIKILKLYNSQNKLFHIDIIFIR